MIQDTPLAAWEQLPMYAVSDELAPRIEELGLQRNLDDLRENGYTIIQVDRELTDRIRAATLRTVEGDVAPNASFDRVCATPLGEDPVFSEACTHPAVLALAEYICGRACILSSVLATVRIAGSALGVHCDQGQVPSPFPEHLVLLTACWVTDEFTEANGAMKMIPGSQKHRRPPTPAESAAADGAIALEAPPGSVILWDGAVWHGNYPRTTPGERVVLHVTYGRLAYQPVHSFSYLSDEFRAGASPEMRTLLGDDLGFGTNSRHVHIDDDRFIRMSLASAPVANAARRRSDDAEQVVGVVVAHRGADARHVGEDLVTAADARDDPQEIAVREAAPVQLPGFLDVERGRAVRRELVEVVA